MPGLLGEQVMPWDDYPDTTRGRARQMLEHPSGTFLKAQKRVRENKATAAKGFDLTGDQRSKKGKIKLASIVAGLFAKNPALGLLNAYGATEGYEDQQKYNNYLENRLAMHGLSETDRAGLMARRYKGESFSSTAPASDRQRGTYGWRFTPIEGQPGQERLQRTQSGTGEMSPVTRGDGGFYDRERLGPMGFSEQRVRGENKLEIIAARRQWGSMDEKRKEMFRKKVSRGSLREKRDRDFLNLLLGEYEGMDPSERDEILEYLFGPETPDQAGLLGSTRSTEDVRSEVDALDEKLGIR